ncbi:hypothetical protein EJB05_26508 [Eragrostis curvula]|uniref:3'-5' exonuclease n=1 Tax=Eragrostis curvula TaxID=38414 RepID=A0A5J9ULE8_9POAL|nr:hypothetical protein EJB05_26508 [Eragrostis curvula]
MTTAPVLNLSSAPDVYYDCPKGFAEIIYESTRNAMPPLAAFEEEEWDGVISFLGDGWSNPSHGARGGFCLDGVIPQRWNLSMGCLPTAGVARRNIPYPVRAPSSSAGWGRIPSSPVRAPSPSAGSWGCPTTPPRVPSPSPSVTVLAPSRSPNQTPPVLPLSPSPLPSRSMDMARTNHDDTATMATTNHDVAANMETINHVDVATTKHDVLFNNKTIDTTVTKSVAVVERFIKEMLGDHREHLLVGLDTEWHKIRDRYSRSGYRYVTAVVQICIGNRCLQDVRRLEKDYCFVVSNPFDIQQMGIRLGYGSEENKPSLKVLVQELLRADMDKDKELHKTWAREELTLKHISYATIDTFASLEVAKAMGVKGQDRAK